MVRCYSFRVYFSHLLHSFRVYFSHLLHSFRVYFSHLLHSFRVCFFATDPVTRFASSVNPISDYKRFFGVRREKFVQNLKPHSKRVEKTRIYTRNEWRRREIHPKRVEKMGKYTRNEWRRLRFPTISVNSSGEKYFAMVPSQLKNTLETSGED